MKFLGFSCIMLAAAAMGTLVAESAHAHARLIASSPTRNATVEAAPKEVSLQFSAPVTLSTGSLELKDAQGRTLKLGKVSRGGGGKSFRIMLPALGEGRYVLRWRIATADHAEVPGVLRFTVN